MLFAKMQKPAKCLVNTSDYETVKPIIVFVLPDTYQSHLKFSDINTCIFITIGSGSFE